MKKTLIMRMVFLLMAKALLGFFLVFIFLESGLRITKHVFLFLQEHRNEARMFKKSAYRILCLGESTTAVGGEDSYPSQLENILNRSNTDVQFCVINKGMPAANSTVIVNLLEEYLVRYNPHMVIAMMGVNDLLAGQGNEFFSPVKKVTFFTELKTYKLARILWLRITKSPDSLERYPRTYQELENNHRKTIEMHPGDQKAYIYLGRCYMDDSQYNRAETFFKKAIEINPANNEPYLNLGQCYRNQSRYDEAEAMFKKALAIKPEDINGYIDLAWCYELQAKHEQAEELFRKIKLMSPKSEKIFGKLAVYHQEQGRYNLADEYFKIAARLRSVSQNPMTRTNYRRLKQLVTQKGIKLVCAQYPMRDAGPLKEMLKPYGAGVVIVDNEKVFKDALTKCKYREYFTDDFGGEFGHGTSLGNRILAENIANCVLNNFFDRK